MTPTSQGAIGLPGFTLASGTLITRKHQQCPTGERDAVLAPGKRSVNLDAFFARQ